MRWLKALFGIGRRAPVDAPVLDQRVQDEPVLDALPFDPTPSGPRFAPPDDAERQCDMVETDRLAVLLANRGQGGDAAWIDAFYDAAWHAALTLPWDSPVEGPDGLPYLRFDLPGEGEFEAVSLGQIAPQCVKGGFGAAIFASSDDPVERAAFVFSMGRIDSILRYDDPDGDPADREQPGQAMGKSVAVEQRGQHQRVTVTGPHQVMIGAPGRDYLPPSSARPLYSHLVDGWGYEEPRVGLMADPALHPSRALIIGVPRSAFPEDAPVDDMMAVLTWYLPPGRSVMLMPEDMDPAQLVPLSDYLEAAPLSAQDAG